MLLHHLAVIHLVDVVAGKNENVLGLLGADGVNVLINGVGGALIPVIADPPHGREDLDEFADFASENVPSFADVTVEGQGLVLGEDVDAAKIRIEAVGEGNVDDAIDAAEGHGGLGAIASERIEALSGAACQKHPESVFHNGPQIFRGSVKDAPGISLLARQHAKRKL